MYLHVHIHMCICIYTYIYIYSFSTSSTSTTISAILSLWYPKTETISSESVQVSWSRLSAHCATACFRLFGFVCSLTRCDCYHYHYY